MDRVAEYLGDRLRGRAVPDDLRRLVELQLDGLLRGRRSVLPFDEVRVLAPGKRHSLEKLRERPDDEPSGRAHFRAIREVLAHVAVVVNGFNGDLYGYWLHPDESPAQPPAIVQLDTEGQFHILPGSTMVEAMVFDWLDDPVDDEELAPIVAFCDRHGLPLLARSHDELAEPHVVISPSLLYDELYRRYHPFTPRPAWAAAEASAEGAPPIGLRITDPPLRALLAQLGFAEPERAIAELDDGLGEVRLESSLSPVTLTLYVDEDGSWWLFSARYRPPTADRPMEVPLPYGFSRHDTRPAIRARLGEPEQTTLLAPADRWRFGGVIAYLYFDEADRLAYLEFWPHDIARRS